MDGNAIADRRRAALVILDGWGYAPPGPGNAVSLADTPVWDGLWSEYPHVLLEASGEAVGLPPEVMGNSEVGHLTLGAGRIVYQDLSRINRAIADGSFFANRALTKLMDGVVARRRAVHLMGLLSDAGVHSVLGHLRALVSMAQRSRAEHVYIHAFTDGRDTSPTAGERYVEEIEAFLAEEGVGAFATVSGRYYAMDRDRRWERVRLAYDALVHGRGLRAVSAGAAVRESYARDETDEFILPTIVSDDPRSRIRDGDGVVFFNFRPDRARELSASLTRPEFTSFDRGGPPPRIDFVGMTEYDPKLGLAVAFPKEEPRNVLAEVVSRAGLTQLHIAETEKYAHVTFFFNGGREDPFPGEVRRLVPSPSDVETYDQKPAMSAYEVAQQFEEIMAEEPVDLVVLNFANPDMVGHTGNLQATVEAVSHVDRCLGRVLRVLERVGAKIMVTADHGNAEEMIEADGDYSTAHSMNKVPLILLERGAVLRDGAGLADVAPTLLNFLGLDRPEEMTGRDLCGECIEYTKRPLDGNLPTTMKQGANGGRQGLTEMRER
ncbi:MAG: 2,3-bisphosphoglycerate-independent phosphoglycerate mutase [Actinobacteria bacterium]|nr:2,3-bisphosphoglycerate-independent phosphoglycerate mutase [Actinomycetota bacterium]